MWLIIDETKKKNWKEKCMIQILVFMHSSKQMMKLMSNFCLTDDICIILCSKWYVVTRNSLTSHMMKKW